MVKILIAYIAILLSIYYYGGIEDYMFGMCFGIGYLSAFHLFYCVNDYFVRKKKMEVMFKDLDNIISPELSNDISSYDTTDTKLPNNNDDDDEDRKDTCK